MSPRPFVHQGENDELPAGSETQILLDGCSAFGLCLVFRLSHACLC